MTTAQDAANWQLGSLVSEIILSKFPNGSEIYSSSKPDSALRAVNVTVIELSGKKTKVVLQPMLVSAKTLPVKLPPPLPKMDFDFNEVFEELFDEEYDPSVHRIPNDTDRKYLAVFKNVRDFYVNNRDKLKLGSLNISSDEAYVKVWWRLTTDWINNLEPPKYLLCELTYERWKTVLRTSIGRTSFFSTATRRLALNNGVYMRNHQPKVNNSSCPSKILGNDLIGLQYKLTDEQLRRLIDAGWHTEVIALEYLESMESDPDFCFSCNKMISVPRRRSAAMAD